MGNTVITFVTDYPNGDYAALYIDGRLAADMEAYEMDAIAVIEILIHRGLLENVEVNRAKIEFEDYANFPMILDDSTAVDD